MKDKRYVFAGNRAFVFQKMQELGLHICRIWAVKGSYLEKYLDSMGLDYKSIEQRETFLEEIRISDFDVFVSNGLPIILPEEVFDASGKTFVNIHPSLLPDLRGRDPVPGAILYRRDSGATCHIMSKGIDSGDIISQVKIPYSEDLDAGLLYQVSFKAEADVFKAAYERNFCPMNRQVLRDTDIYYSYCPTDLDIDLCKDTAEVIASKINAFSTGNKGARLHVDSKIFICSDIKVIQNSYIKKQFYEAVWGKILLQYENRIIVKNAFNELLNITVKNYGGGVNKWKLIQLFTMDKLWFPLIVSIIEQNQEGIVFANDKSNPTHAFVINKFGFCQEAYEEYDDVFFQNVIRPYIESKDRMKLRMYHPGKQMKQYLLSLSYATKATRMHMVHTDARIIENQTIDYVIKEVEKEDVLGDDFGLDLMNRYYNGVDDFIKQAKAMGAYTEDGKMIGIVYSAGEALGVCEKDIFVDSKFRGRGIGKKLTECFIEKCGEDHKLVSEDIYENNNASVALAKATGAQLVEKYEYFNIDK